jgi:hypothetical protein
VRVPAFRPGTHGFQVSNGSFAERPDLFVPTAFGTIAVGSASNGLCGGMVYAVRDLFEAGLPVPPGTANPDSGPLFDHIVHRLFDSFDIPGGVATYLELMHPGLPDHETDLSRAGLAPHGRSWRMVVEEWPRVKGDLDHGRLSPLALVLVKSADPGQLGKNHQVLAYGYDLAGTALTIHVYDPNAPQDDTVTLTLDIAHPEHTTSVMLGATPVVAFFRTRYTFEAPPGFRGGTTLRCALRARANGKLVCAEDAGARPLVANRDRVGPWETFEVTVVGSNRVVLRATANGRFVTAAGGAPLVAGKVAYGPDETFEIAYVPGNDVSLRSLGNHRLVCAEDAGAKPLVANRDQVGPWETFTLVPVS